ncbi:MAG: molybdate ABC transporter substrate-binding protein [Bdellovibrionota bacterium]
MLRRLALLASLLIAVHSGAATIRVSAAASLTDVLQEVARGYQTATGDHLVFNFGSSGALARQIIEGAPVDVFLSADERQMDRVAGKGFVIASTRRSILSNTLVVIVPRESTSPLKEPKDLTSDDVARIAIGDPETVPAGDYARAYLRRAGVWSNITKKLIPVENVRASLAAVEAENVDCGIVYKSDALISKLVKVAFELRGTPEISYPGAVIATSPNRAAAQRFLDYLGSPPSRTRFEKYGFIVK